MNQIFLMGDTHGDFRNITKLLNTVELNQDLVIVLGDFGFIWDGTYQNNTNTLQKVFSTHNSILAFLDGNHENFEIINNFPVASWKGGQVHWVDNNIVHLMRGQVFEFFNKTFFVMGGANSIDKANRINRVSWWKEEDITFHDMVAADNNLKQAGDQVDYVLTHTCPAAVKAKHLFKSEYDNYNENQLQQIADTITYKHWYYGHMHADVNYENFTCVWNKIIKIEGDNSCSLSSFMI